MRGSIFGGAGGHDALPKWLGAAILGLAAGAALSPAPVSAAAELGQEVAIDRHLQDGEEYQIPLRALVRHGGQLFNAMWTNQEGGGRPLTKGTGGPLVRPGAAR